MRVYLPATFHVLADLLVARSLGGPLPAYAVTPALRAWADLSGRSDDEELELVALSEAARESLRLLAGSPVSPAARVVVAADVPDDAVRVDDGSEAAGPGQVVVMVDVPLGWVRAAHIDEAAAGPDVLRAAASVRAADADDPAAEADVARLDQHDLLWYAPDELPGLVAGGG